MRFGIWLTLIAAVLATSAMWIGEWGLLLLWPAVSFALLASGYFGLGARVFGKRQDGTLHPVSVALMLPFLLGTWLVISVANSLSRRPPYQQLVPGVLIGRRLSAREYPDGVTAVLDLTAELHAPSQIVQSKQYRCLPILDTGVPTTSELVGAVRDLQRRTGTTLVHCAQGHGRTGLVASALLIAEGLATTPEDALALAQQRRPGIRLSPVQAALLSAVAPDLTSAPQAGSPAG